MARIRTHYEVLGVTRHATPSELRRAHRDLARLLHPDHLATVNLEAKDRKLADIRIREVNEAWRVLGDPTRRARYDATLADEPEEWIPPWEAPRQQPTRTVASTSRARSHERVQESASGNPTRPFRWIPLLVCVTIILAGVVTLAVIAGGGGPSPEGPTGGAPEGTCVTIVPGPITRTVPCDVPNDGKVVGFVTQASDCPPGADVRRLAVGDTSLGCLIPSGSP